MTVQGVALFMMRGGRTDFGKRIFVAGPFGVFVLLALVLVQGYRRRRRG